MYYYIFVYINHLNFFGGRETPTSRPNSKVKFYTGGGGRNQSVIPYTTKRQIHGVVDLLIHHHIYDAYTFETDENFLQILNKIVLSFLRD